MSKKMTPKQFEEWRAVQHERKIAFLLGAMTCLVLITLAALTLDAAPWPRMLCLVLGILLAGTARELADAITTNENRKEYG